MEQQHGVRTSTQWMQIVSAAAVPTALMDSALNFLDPVRNFETTWTQKLITIWRVPSIRFCYVTAFADYVLP